MEENDILDPDNILSLDDNLTGPVDVSEEDSLSPDSLLDADAPAVSATPQLQPERKPGSMPPEAQQLTYLMAKELQAVEARRLADEGWSYAPVTDAQKKESPALRPFDRMGSDQKRPYLTASANAVMSLLDEGFILKPSAEPDVAMPDEARQAALRYLMSKGRTEKEAGQAVDAIEAAGFSIMPGPSKGMKKMNAYFEMASNGRPVNAEEARVLVRSTVNMARKENIPLKEINAFIASKNAEYGIRERPINRRQEKERLIGAVKAIYEKSWDEAYRSYPVTFVSVKGMAQGVVRDADFMRIYTDAVRDARRKILPMVETMRNPQARRELLAVLDTFEKKEFLDGHRKKESRVAGAWKERLDDAVSAAAALNAFRQKEGDRMRQWKEYRWYERVFIPKPRASEAREAELRQRRDEAVKALSKAYAEDHAEGRYFDGKEPSAALDVSISISEKGRPVLQFKKEVEGRLVEDTRLLIMEDGAVKDVSGAEERRRESVATALDARRREIVEEMKAAAVLSMQYRTAEEERKSLFPEKDIATIAREMDERRERLASEAAAGRRRTEDGLRRDVQAEKERDAVQHRERDEEFPSLHPNLAGDITPQDVYILKAYRLKGSDGKNLQDIINALKEKRLITVEGTMTYRQAHSWDTHVPTERVYVGLRLGASGSIIVTNPMSGKDIGPVRSVFGKGYNLDFGGVARQKDEQARAQAQKEANRFKKTVV